MYGIEVGDFYVAADGSNGGKIIIDVTTHADVDDVIAVDCDRQGNIKPGTERRIDAFKLHMCRYSLYKKSGDQ